MYLDIFQCVSMRLAIPHDLVGSRFLSRYIVATGRLLLRLSAVPVDDPDNTPRSILILNGI